MIHNEFDTRLGGPSRYNRDAHDPRHSPARFGGRARGGFPEILTEHPLVMGALALAVGALIGLAMRSTRYEDQWLGETRDHLRDNAMSYARTAKERGRHLAEAAYHAASGEAERQGLKPSSEGPSVAEKVANVAGRASDAAKDQAKKEGLT